MTDQFFADYSPSELYASIGCTAEYVGYEDQNVTHLDIPHLFPSECVFKLKSFMDMCESQHATDDGQPSDYEEVWINGILKARGGFRSGRPFGCWRFFHDNGQCSEVINLNADGKFYGEHALLDVKGDRSFSFCWHPSRFTGTLKEWYPNGQIKCEVPISDGKKEGPCRRWYENGRIASDMAFVADELSGSHTLWNSEGVTVFEKIQVEGTRLSHEKQYSDKGQLMRMRSYLDHQQHGEEIQYFDFDRRVMLDKTQVSYYVLGKKVTQDEFFAWKGEAS